MFASLVLGLVPLAAFGSQGYASMTEDSNVGSIEYSSTDLNLMIEQIASEVANNNSEPNQVTSIESQKSEIIQQLSNDMNKLQLTRTPKYDRYKYDSATIKYAYLRGYAGGQPSAGYTRKTGDRLYWSKSGGPTVSVSVSLGWKAVGVSASLGTGGTSAVGSGFRVPSNGRWKVYADLTYKVCQPNIWGHPYGSPEGTWVRVDAIPTKTYYGDNTRLIKQ